MKLRDTIKQTVSGSILESQATASLTQENAILKQQLELASSQSDGEFYLHVDQFRPSSQVRQTFLVQEIKERAKSLVEEGQASAIILIPLENDPNHKAQIEDGELTWRAAKWLIERGNSKWQQLKCCWSKLSKEEDPHTKSLIHHRHKVNLNPLDEAEGLMLEIAKATSWGNGEKPENRNKILKSILGSISSQYQRKPKFAEMYNSLLTQTKEDSLATLNKCKQEFNLDERKITVILQCRRYTIRNPHTFYKVNIPLVFLTEQLKDAIRHSTTPLLVNHALAISRVKDRQKQQDLIEQCQANSWSLKELRSAIKDLKESNQESLKPESYTKQRNQVIQGIKILSKSNVGSLTPKQAKTLAKSLRAKLELLEARANE